MDVSTMSSLSANLTTVISAITTLSPSPKVDPDPDSEDIITSSIAEFEVILPCIFGTFVVLSLSLMMFYSKGNPHYEVNSKPITTDMSECGMVDTDRFVENEQAYQYARDDFGRDIFS